MLFNTFKFFPFLVAIVVLFNISNTRFKKLILLAASYTFYGFWDWRFCFLLGTSTVIDFFCAIWLEKTKEQKKRNLLLAISLTGNLGILIFFKYYNFFVENFAALLSQVGMSPNLLTLKIILPVGISFYTLQTLAYTIDVWRGRMKATNSFIDFANYVAFFPQLVAGPIERAQTLLPQLTNLQKPTRKMIEEGTILFLIGYFKKVIVSDNIAGVADRIFGNFRTLDAFELWQGLFVFALQVYFDFSGYSNIARGIAKWFGVELVVNFDCPHFRKNVTAFWRNWHISLSSWIRDYVYIPMGGSRVSPWRGYFNIFFSMVLVGVWHGANWTFVAFGAAHGFYLCVHKRFGSQDDSKDSLITSAFKILAAQTFIILTYILFRSPNISEAMLYYERMFFGPFIFEWTGLFFIFFIISLLVIVDGPIHYFKDFYYMRKLPKSWKYPLYVLILLTTLWLLINQQGEARPFVYFQF